MGIGGKSRWVMDCPTSRRRIGRILLIDPQSPARAESERMT